MDSLYANIYEEALRLYKNRHFDECAGLLETVSEKDTPITISILAALNYFAAGNKEKSAVYLKKIMAAKPREQRDLYNTAYLCESLGMIDEAIKYYQEILATSPDYIPAINNLSNIYKSRGILSEAFHLCSNGILINHSSYELHNAAGNILSSMGKIDDALIHYRKAIALASERPEALSNFLLTLNYSSSFSAESIAQRHFKMTEFLAALCRKDYDFSNHGKSQKIRIGYLSGDFKQHSVSFFIEPLLFFHNRDAFDIFCYSDLQRPDDVTKRISGFVENWIDISAMSDEEIAGRIYSDKIDILIDLAVHTGKRIKVFMMKPAPIQVNYLGYPNTSGLRTMDYRITDALTDPPGSEKLFTETLVRPFKTFLCYAPSENAPDPGELPALKNGFITFASFNNLSKITDEVIAAWAKILSQIPKSRLIIKNIYLNDPELRISLARKFSEAGIDSNRIDSIGFINKMEEHLEFYKRADIALDTFPYNGTTTTFEALWMGLPVITLRGDRHAARVGCGILANLGLELLAAENIEKYIDTACFLSDNLEMLNGLRAALRQTLSDSPFCRPKDFVHALEIFYADAVKKYRNRAK